MKKVTLYATMTVMLIVLSGYLLLGQDSGGNSVSAGSNSDSVQVVKLSVQGANYVLNPSTLKVNVPVRIEADISKMPGCSKSVVIPAFNIRKVVTQSDNTIEFIPTQSGTFNIACSMNMYRGTFTVK